MTSDEIRAVQDSHRRWLSGDRSGQRADLSRANLSGADLSRANLSGAYLLRADLTGADLTGADLSDADLTGAKLSGADLTGADLTGADLSRADLTCADLSGANLSRADLPTGEKWETYIGEVVPQLLLAGERGVAALSAWGNHTWDDCPIATAFSIHCSDDAPALLRPRILQFIQFFDAGLIPRPEIKEEAQNG